MFIHLTTHSAYSLQESLIHPSELARAAADYGMPAVGLTDHFLLTGSVEFVHACQDVGIQPILGLEIDLESGPQGSSPLALLATSQEGWSNLCRISSALALREQPASACSLDFLAPFSNGLLALFSTPGDPTDQGLLDLKDIYDDRLYLAFSDPSTGLPWSHLARQVRLPTVVTHPVYYLTPDQENLQRTLTAIRLNQTIDTLTTDKTAPPKAYFTSQREMLVRFSGFRSALERTQEIAERCQFELPLGVANMPKVPLPDGMTQTQFLRQKAQDGARKIFGEITPEIQARLDHEIEVISNLGYEPVFLIVEDILTFARKTGVPYSSRGSAASSLVAHCLGITSPDPLRLNLYFERFLNPARLTPPDIDTDLCSRRRDSVIRHVFDTYGNDRVAMVATINHYRSRSALSDVGKAYGFSPDKIREMVSNLPHRFWRRNPATDEDKGHFSPFEELRELYPSTKFQQVFDDAEALLKLPRHLSVHPGGLIVSPGPVTDLVPIMRSGSKGIMITQLDLKSVEALGLVKIDLLGIRGLTVLGDVAEFIQENQSDTYDTPMSVLENTPAEDDQTADLVEHGQTIGCFQIESPGMRATLREIHARSEEDIMAALALYRPGPLTGGLKDAFVRRYKGEESVQHIHPALRPLLDETFGVILYQEQVLRIAHTLAGFSLAEADLLRRAMSHFDPGRRMQELRKKFVSEVGSRSGIPVEIGERIWEMMAAFAGYGFPKAHAASYAKVAWRSAWCKTHFPAEFMAAVLANWGGYYSQRVYLSEARRMGLTIRPPHINHSRRNFTTGVVHFEGKEEKLLFMGLDQIKHLTRRTMTRIIQHSPYQSLEDFLSRVDPRPQEAENLARVGALDGLGLIPAILRRLGGKWQSRQMSLFVGDAFDGDDWSLEQKMAAQKELLGISLEAHPLELLADQIAESGAVSTAEAAEKHGEHVIVAGIRQISRRTRTSRGETMLFLTLEDLAGTLDVIVFPDVYQRYRALLRSEAPFLISGLIEIDQDHGDPYLRADRVQVFR